MINLSWSIDRKVLGHINACAVGCHEMPRVATGYYTVQRLDTKVCFTLFDHGISQQFQPKLIEIHYVVIFSLRS